MRDKAADTGVLTRWGAGSCATCLIYRPQHGRGHVQLKERPSASASGKSTRADSAHTTVNWLAPGRARAQAAYKRGCSTRTTTPVLRTRIFSNPGVHTFCDRVGTQEPSRSKGASASISPAFLHGKQLQHDGLVAWDTLKGYSWPPWHRSLATAACRPRQPDEAYRSV